MTARSANWRIEAIAQTLRIPTTPACAWRSLLRGKVPLGEGLASRPITSVAGASGYGAAEAYTVSLWGVE